MKKFAAALIVTLLCGTSAIAAKKPEPVTGGELAASAFFTGRYLLFTVLGAFGTLTGAALVFSQVTEKRRTRDQRDVYEKQLASFRKSLGNKKRR